MTTHRLTRYHLCEEALKLPDLRQALYDEGAILMRDVLVNLHGEAHKARRRVEGQLFRRAYFRQLEMEVLPALMARALAERAEDEHLELKSLAYDLMLNVSLLFAGIDRQAGTQSEAKALSDLLVRLGQAATLGQYTGDQHAAVVRDIEAAMEEFDRLYLQPSKARRLAILQSAQSDVSDSLGQEATQSGHPDDVLTLLLRHQQALDMDDAGLLREVAFFYLASAHTSVHSIVHAFHEIHSWAEQSGRSVKALGKDQALLQQCVHESLRLHPSSPESWRRALAPHRLSDGTEIEAGDQVIIELETANRDTDVFGSDASVFNPLRARPPGRNPSGLSFGLGMHVCIGLNLVAGTIVRDEQALDETTHQYGSMTVILRELIAAGLAPDPDRPGVKDAESKRDTWLAYPLISAS